MHKVTTRGLPFLYCLEKRESRFHWCEIMKKIGEKNGPEISEKCKTLSAMGLHGT
jgi:hypothetical protein